MAVFGSLIKWGIGGYGEKPVVPQYTPVSPDKEQIGAIEGNLKAMPQATQLATQVNTFNMEQLQKMLATMIPGYHGIQSQISNNIQSQLRGEIPQGVQQAVQNASAARAVGGGYAGSGMGRNLVARDFGLTSYDITNKGLDSANRWLQLSASIAQPSFMDVTSMFISPQQRIAYAFQNTQNQFQRDWVGNQIDAMPDPAMALTFLLRRADNHRE